MYSKVIVFLCAAGIASAGNLLGGGIAYGAPASVAYSVQSTAHAAPIAAYAAPVISKAIVAPAISSHSAAPAVSYQSISRHSSPIISAAPVSYAAPIAAAPVSYAAPISVAAPVASYAPSHLSYSSAPAVSYQSISRHSSSLGGYAAPIATSYAAPIATSYAAAAPVISRSYGISSYSSPLAIGSIGSYRSLGAVKSIGSYASLGAVKSIGSYGSLGGLRSIGSYGSLGAVRSVGSLGSYSNLAHAPIARIGGISAYSSPAISIASPALSYGIRGGHGW